MFNGKLVDMVTADVTREFLKMVYDVEWTEIKGSAYGSLYGQFTWYLVEALKNEEDVSIVSKASQGFYEDYMPDNTEFTSNLIKALMYFGNEEDEDVPMAVSFFMKAMLNEQNLG